jgi:hypothetical protein
MLEIDRRVSSAVSAPPERCMALLADVERYPSWSSLISHAERHGDRIRLRASVLGVGFEMACSLELTDGTALLRRIPNDADDEERFDAAWTVESGSVTLHVRAAFDAPGPARLIRGRVERAIADGLLADFVAAL